LPVFASPFDITAVDFLESLECPIYKVASPEITDHGLIDYCAATGKPVILSTGLASMDDLREALAILDVYKAPRAVLKCVSAYPTPIDVMNVSSIPWLRAELKCNVGLSDHTIGPEAAFAASALGASIIEKHFRLPQDTTSVDAQFSMSLSELPALKRSVELVFRSIGRPSLDIPDLAVPSMSGRRSLYAVKDINAGEIITVSNVRSIRPSFGLHPKHLPSILGRKAVRRIEAGERIDWESIEKRGDKSV